MRPSATSGIEKLAAELDQFGGGSSVQSSRHKVVVWVKGTCAPNVVRHTDGNLLVRDPKAPAHEPSAERCFKVPYVIFGELDAHGTKLNEEVCKVRPC